jgi:hypothetical protein
MAYDPARRAMELRQRIFESMTADEQAEYNQSEGEMEAPARVVLILTNGREYQINPADIDQLQELGMSDAPGRFSFFPVGGTKRVTVRRSAVAAIEELWPNPQT